MRGRGSANIQMHQALGHRTTALHWLPQASAPRWVTRPGQVRSHHTTPPRGTARPVLNSRPGCSVPRGGGRRPSSVWTPEPPPLIGRSPGRGPIRARGAAPRAVAVLVAWLEVCADWETCKTCQQSCQPSGVGEAKRSGRVEAWENESTAKHIGSVFSSVEITAVLQH